MSKFRYVDVDVDLPVTRVEFVPTRLRCACLMDEFGNPHVKHVYSGDRELDVTSFKMTEIQLKVFSKALDEDFHLCGKEEVS